MSRYLLATPIVGRVTKPVPPKSLLVWMAGQTDENLFISALTLAEVRRGVPKRPAGRTREQLGAWFAGPEGPSALFAGLVLPFDEKAGLMAGGTAQGRSLSAPETIIAAVAEADEWTVGTDNEKDFIGVETFNPLRDPS